MAKQVDDNFKFSFIIHSLKEIEAMCCRQDSVILNNKDFIIDGRSNEDMLSFAKELSHMIKYFDLSGSNSQDWSKFLSDIDIDLVSKLIDDIQCERLSHDEKYILLYKNLGAHQVLFFIFLSLIKYPKANLNELVSRHLNYYYRDCLQLQEIPMVPAKAHIVFQTVEGVDQYVIPKNTLLTTRKDQNLNSAIYSTDEELLATSARIRQVYTVASIDDSFAQTEILNEKQKIISTDFKTFGDKNGKISDIGFAIASSTLNSSSGTKSISLKLIFSGDNNNFCLLDNNDIKSCFNFYCTGVEGWSPLDVKEASFSSNSITFQFEDIDCPILPPENYDCGISVADQLPVLKAVFNSSNLDVYKACALATIKTVKIESEARNVDDLELSNDLGVLSSASGLIYPFGPDPVKGLSLYLTHRDLIGQNISDLKVEIDWLNLPDNFNDYYHDYDSDSDICNSSFKVKIKIYDENLVEDSDKDVSLFEEDEKGQLSSTSKILVVNRNDKVSSNNNYINNSDNPKDYSIYFGLCLQQDFYQSEYPVALAKLARDKKIESINPPYIPACSGIKICSYRSTEEIEISNDMDKFQLFGPYGGESGGVVPQYPLNGSLLIGIESLQKGKTLSMLWESGSNADQAKNDLEWSYLLNDKWYNFNSDSSFVISDKTDGFKHSGIILFQIPETINNDNKIVPCDLYWLRISLKSLYGDAQKSVTRFINLNSVIVSLDDAFPTDKDLSRLKPLSITNLLYSDPNIKNIVQPYKGFGGKLQEGVNSFLTRISNRLRHRNRSINVWDYEWMILDAFHEVHKVKCIRTANLGEVQIYVVVFKEYSIDSNIPTASLELLKRIKLYLERHASPFAQIKVSNAQFVQKKCFANVVVKEGYFNFARKNVLVQDLERYFSPWGDKNLSGQVEQQEVAKFLGNQNYVKQIVSLDIRDNLDNIL